MPFPTTAQAVEVEGVVGQDRAVEALHFGIGIRNHGYNIFAVGPPGVGKQTLLRQFLENGVDRGKPPADWCYVHDFADDGRPRLLELPNGRGAKFAQDLSRALGTLRVALRAAFASAEYRTRKQKLLEPFQQRQQDALTEVEQRAQQRDVALLHTETGIGVAPLADGDVMPPKRFNKLPESERASLQRRILEIGEELSALLRKFSDWDRERREATRALDREIARETTQRTLAQLREDHADLPDVVAHLDELVDDVTDSIDDLVQQSGTEDVEKVLQRALEREKVGDGPLRRYQVNLLVDNANCDSAPIIYEDNPTLGNLVGRVEHESHFGTTVTHFMLIKAGALHRAVGGYLVVDALKLLLQPFAWDALKRAIRSSEIRFESAGQTLGLIPAATLEPEPVPLRDTKVILVGNRLLYYLLAAVDPDYLELFKVLVDFEEQMDRAAPSQRLYARLLATLVHREQLRPFDRGAIARVIDYASRRAGDADKLSVKMREVVDLLRESSYFATKASNELVTADDVQTAIDAQRRRARRVHDWLREAMQRGDVLVETSGEQVGQINGLSVFQLGEQTFGIPTRITARARLGGGELVDIEREVKLGGPIHSKGVLIISGFVGARYALDVPLSLSATLVFEQSYGGVEGDSASLAELCALLSSLSGAAIRQRFAVTGSVDQRGQVQGIGGVNDKIEGFFDICKDRGLTGDQGVLIPTSNVKNLMLRQEVVEAVRDRRFHVHAVASVDDALELLTGEPAGRREDDGAFTAGSVNARVEKRLQSFAQAAREFAADSKATRRSASPDPAFVADTPPDR